MQSQQVVDWRSSTGGTESADRVADVLLLFSRADGMLGVSEIARSLGLSKAVVHRILQSLMSRGLIQMVLDSSNYVLGPSAISMGSKAWSQLDLRSVAGPVLRSLRDETRETTTLSVLASHARVYLDQYESPQEIKMVVEVGARHPLHSGASSRVILAFMPSPYTDEALEQLKGLKPEFDTDDYRHRLEKVRCDGYAMSLNERNIGAASIAAPIFDKNANALGAISSCGPIFRFDGHDSEVHVGKVIAAARRITALLSN